MDETTKLPAPNGSNPPLAPRGLPTARTTPIAAELATDGNARSFFVLAEQCQREIQAYRRGEPTSEACGLDLWHRAIVHGDQDARAAFEQYYGEMVRSWLQGHPSWETARRWEREECSIALAFERFWQVIVEQPVPLRTPARAFVCLRASLGGVILETLRASAQQRAAPWSELEASPMQDVRQRWESLQQMLPSTRERRLAYLLYHCGLSPGEIARCCPEEWSDPQEIARLRRTILERLLDNTNQLTCAAHTSEAEETERLSPAFGPSVW